MNAYNVQPAEVDIHVIAGDYIDIDFAVTLPEGDDPLTECDLDMQIRKPDGSLLRHLKSYGDDPELVAVSTGFSIVTEPVNDIATYWYDIIKTKTDKQKTFVKGKFIVSKRQTSISE